MQQTASLTKWRHMWELECARLKSDWLCVMIRKKTNPADIALSHHQACLLQLGSGVYSADLDAAEFDQHHPLVLIAFITNVLRGAQFEVVAPDPSAGKRTTNALSSGWSQPIGWVARAKPGLPQEDTCPQRVHVTTTQDLVQFFLSLSLSLYFELFGTARKAERLRTLLQWPATSSDASLLKAKSAVNCPSPGADCISFPDNPKHLLSSNPTLHTDNHSTGGSSSSGLG